MDSQIFQNTMCKKTSSAISGASAPILWVSVALLFMAVILFPERPAWGSDFDIHVIPHEIQGYTNDTELIDVLEVSADEGGYTFFIGKEMVETLINYNISDLITAEKAIGQIIHPSSHAIIFGKTPNSPILHIEQVRIYYDNPNPIAAGHQPTPSGKTRLIASTTSYKTE